MSSTQPMDAQLRERLIAQPDVLLDDTEIMRALVAANERQMGHNIVDLRGIAMERLEARLDRLEDAHRSVIAAAYENLAGTNQIHRAVLRLLEATRFEAFLEDLSGDVADILRVDALKLVLESHEAAGADMAARWGTVLEIVPPGFANHYVTRGRAMPARNITLRQTGGEEAVLYGAKADYVRSEALLKLDFGPGRLPGLLALGSEDPHQFNPQHGTDLLAFFGGVFERAMRRWLD